MKVLLLELKSLRAGPNRFKLDLAPEDLELGDIKGAEVVGRLRGELVAVKGANAVEVKITLTWTFKLVCSRCLDEFEREFTEEAKLTLRRGKPRLKKELALSDEDIETVYFEGEEVDLAPFVREMVVLAIPMKPLCRPDCKGLCPICGANWNRETCEHREAFEKGGGEKPPDPRWAKLLELKGKLGGKK